MKLAIYIFYSQVVAFLRKVDAVEVVEDCGAVG
jgi:hypothetical protein